MQAIEHPLRLEKGSAHRLTFALTTAGLLFDLTGYTARMHIRAPDGALADDLTTANGRLLIDVVAGALTVEFPASITAAMTISTAAYDLELTPPSGADSTWKLARGRVTYRAEVTR